MSKQSKLNLFFKVSNTINNSENIANPQTEFDNPQTEKSPSPPCNILEASSGENSEIIINANNTTDCEPPLKKRKSKHDTFLPKWIREFPWLELEKDNDGNVIKVFCRSCKAANMKLAMAVTGSTNFQHSAFSRHESSLEHRSALVSKVHKESMHKIMYNPNVTVSQGEITVFKTIYMMAKEEMSQTKFKPIIMLLKNTGNESLNQTHMNLHHQTITEIESVFADSLMAQTDQSVKESPFISIYIDESTDVAVHHKLIIYVRYINNDQTKTQFWANLLLPIVANAENLEKVLLDFLTEKGISISKVLGLASDGAAVMMGKKNGVGKRLKDKFPLLLHFHCIAHKLALCISQASTDIGQLQKAQKVLGGLYSYFHSSHVRTAELKALQKIMEMKEISLKEIHEIRWLSLGKAVEACFLSYDAIVLALTDIVETRKKSPTDAGSGLLKQCTEYSFVASLCMLQDLLPIIDRLSKVFQCEDVHFSTLVNELLSINVRLQFMKNNMGKNEMEFVTQTNQNGYYREIKLTMKQSSLEEFKNIKSKFYDSLMQNINNRFDLNEMSILTDLDNLLNPSCQPSTTSKNVSLNNVISRFCRNNNDYQCKLPSSDGLNEEWLEVEGMLQRSKGMKMKDFCSVLILYCVEDQQVYPNFALLAQIALVLPLSTACCERGFSTQNRIKTSRRTKIADKHLQDLSRIAEIGPEFTEKQGVVECTFDFESAITTWKRNKRRRLIL